MKKLVVKRKRGRPARSRKEDLVGTPRNLKIIEEMYLRNVPLWKIGEEVGCSDAAVAYHLKKTIKPLWKERLQTSREKEEARVDYIEEVAWQRFLKSMSLGNPKDRIEAIALMTREGITPETVDKIVRRFEKTGEAVWLTIIQWCIEWRSKVGGYYIDKKDLDVTLRVAGTSREELDKRMAARVLEKIKQYDKGSKE